ncbi:MAG: exodeoxyribonuclease VII large subunit [Clostridiales bacterium]|nr:exodeoxyribonuclease VII large subunit [Clostridiales bacterium]
MEPKTVTVSQINNYLKRLIDHAVQLNDVWVKGELSNFKLHYSGHIYTTLKDEGGVLKAVMFKSSASKLSFEPKDGMKVLARGKVGVYEAGGVYQLYIEEMIPDGVGELYIAYEQLKARLGEEGLFDQRYKKPIPRYPKCVGVVTAPTGAAVRDIINVITRRYPLAEIVIYPAQVQGMGAKESIAEAIEYFNENRLADTLIVGRGGGSIEDLWAFNEELVARAIFNSKIPVISAVGHETDFTIADFVADLRAPTPSAAAELAVPSAAELASSVQTMLSLGAHSVLKALENRRMHLKALRPKNPKDIINDGSLKLDTLTGRLLNGYKMKLMSAKKQLSQSGAKLDALSPLRTMARGYSIPLSSDGSVIRSAKELSPGTEFTLKLNDGQRRCRVEE